MVEGLDKTIHTFFNPLVLDSWNFSFNYFWEGRMLSQAPGNGRSHTRRAQEPCRASLLPHWLTAVVLSLLKEPHFGRSHSMKKLSIISTYGNASQGLHGCPRRDHSEQLSSFSMHFLFLSPFEMGYQGKWVSSLNKSKQKKQDFWFKLAMLSIFLFLLCSPPISSKWQYKENQEEWRA